MLYNNLTPGNGMNKKDLFLGFIIGIATTILGSYLFITFFTDFKFIAGIQIMKSQGNLGKIITLGSILTLIDFIYLSLSLYTDKQIIKNRISQACI